MRAAQMMAGSQRRSDSIGSRPPASARAGRTVRVLLDDERVVVVVAVQGTRHRPAVDEERRGRVDSGARARLHVLADTGAGRRVVEAGAEVRDVEAHVAGVAEEARALELFVVVEEDVLLLPETPLPAGA